MLVPPARRSTWSLACLLRRPARAEWMRAEHAEMLRELTVGRGKSPADLEEMFALVDRVGAFLQPPYVEVAHVIADESDLLFACEVAEKQGHLAASDAEHVRAVIARHA